VSKDLSKTYLVDCACDDIADFTDVLLDVVITNPNNRVAALPHVLVTLGVILTGLFGQMDTTINFDNETEFLAAKVGEIRPKGRCRRNLIP
jgi:hypothetical protein